MGSFLTVLIYLKIFFDFQGVTKAITQSKVSKLFEVLFPEEMKMIDYQSCWMEMLKLHEMMRFGKRKHQKFSAE